MKIQTPFLGAPDVGTPDASLYISSKLDGRAAAVWGTHTHVQTADERVNPKGTGYITDIGMTGPIVSVLGVRVEQSIAMFRGDLTEYFKTAEGDCAVSGALFDITRNGKCNSVTRVWERWNVR